MSTQQRSSTNLQARVNKLSKVSFLRILIKELYCAGRCWTKETALQFMSCWQCLVDSAKTSSNKNTVNASTYGFDRISRCKFFSERVVLREEFCEFHPEREGNAHTDSIDTSAKKWKRGNQEDFLPLGGGCMENEHFCSRQGIFKYRRKRNYFAYYER